MDKNLLDFAAELYRSGRAFDAAQPDRRDRYRNVEEDSARFLNLIARSISPSRALELGTSNGYSTLWLADAMPKGTTFVSVDNDQGRHEQAARNLAEAGLGGKVNLQLGDAGELLAELPDRSIDFIFLDAERPAYVGYWPQLKRVLTDRGLLIVDNCISHADQVADFRAAIDATDGAISLLIPIGAGLLLVAFDRAAAKAGERSCGS